MRWRCAGALACALAAAAAALPAGVGSAKGPVTVVVWFGWRGEAARRLQEVLDAFNRSQTDIRVQPLSGINYQRLLTGIAAGDPPDLAELDYHELGEWAQSNWVEPLGGYVKGSGLSLSSFEPSALEMGIYRGHLYGVPFLEDVLALYYNRGLLQALKVPVATSLSALAEQAVSLSQTGPGGQLVRVGFDPAYPGSNFLVLVRAFGGHIFRPDGRYITPLNPGVRQALAWEASIFQKLGPVRLDRFQAEAGSLLEPRNAFFDGRLVYVIAGEWLQKRLARYAPHLSYGVEPFPRSSPGLPAPTTIQGGVWVVPHGARHPKEAMRVLAYLEQPSVQEKLALATGNLPTLRAALASPDLVRAYPFERLFLSLAASPRTQPDRSTLMTGTYVQALQSAESQVLQGHWSLDQALSRVLRYQHFLTVGYSPLVPVSRTQPLGRGVVNRLVQSVPVPGLSFHDFGPSLYVARSPESFFRTGVLYRDVMSGTFRTYLYQRNATGRPVEVGLAFTNTGKRPIRLWALRHGGGISPYPDIAGNEAIRTWWAHTYRRALVGQIPPGRTLYLLHPLKAGLTNCDLDQWQVTQAGSLAPASAVVSTLAVSGPPPDNPLTLPVVLHDLNPRGTYPHADVGATVRFPVTGGPEFFDVGNIPLFSGGSRVIPGEYRIGYDALDRLPVMNNGNFGVMYEIHLLLTNPGQNSVRVVLVLQNLGGGGHYIAQIDGRTYLTPFMKFYQSSILHTFVVPPHRTLPTDLVVSVPGGATAPERLYLVTEP